VIRQVSQNWVELSKLTLFPSTIAFTGSVFSVVMGDTLKINQ